MKKPVLICKHIGCQQLETVKGYCQRHQNRGFQRDRQRQSLYDRSWERASKGFLAEHPWCHDCRGVATEVHHRQKHLGDANLFWDENNWLGLCHRCHSKRTRRGE